MHGGTYHTAPGGFNEPSGLAVGMKTFVADTVNQRIARFNTATGAFKPVFGRARLGDGGSERLRLAERRHVERRDEHGLGGRHEEQPGDPVHRTGAPTGRVFGQRGRDAHC